MDNQNNKKNINKTTLGIIVGVFVTISALSLFFKVHSFLEERKIAQRIQANNINASNQEFNNSQPLDEPRDIPPVDSSSNSLDEPRDIPPIDSSSNSLNNNSSNFASNNNSLIGLENAKQIAISTVGGGTIVSQEEDIYDIDDIPTYNFTIKQGGKIYELEINALDGTVLEFDND